MGVYELDPAVAVPQMKFFEPWFLPRPLRPLYSSVGWRWRHSQQFSAVYTHTLGWWKTRRNQLFVHEAADLAAKRQQLRGWRKIKYGVWQALYINLGVRPATRIFAATAECAAYLERVGIRREKIVQSGSWYDERIFQYHSRQRPKQRVQILFVGREDNPAKGFVVTRELFYGRAGYSVRVAGSRRRGTDHNFQFLGYLTPRALADTLAQSDVFFMPSVSEGFSIALLEALATGIPCVVDQRSVHATMRAIPNVVVYQRRREIEPLLRRIIRDYDRYCQPVDTIERFSKSVLVRREYEVMRALAASGR